MKRKRPSLPTKVPRDPTLPILQKSAAILSAISANDVLILVSETGSGKTTQLPQLILDSDPAASIVITQPRRVAAITVANRVAAERGVSVGEEVGYAVRFEDKSQRGLTRVRYVTDGVLLREVLAGGGGGLKKRYSHVIVDEVHERSVNTDIVLGIIKDSLVSTAASPVKGGASSFMARFRSQLAFKVIIMSATTDADKISSYFRDGTSLTVKSLLISGRTHKVSTMYSTHPVSDYVGGAVEAAEMVLSEYKKQGGDILVFLPGQDDINAAVSMLKKKIRVPKKGDSSRVFVFPLYAALSPADQLQAIESLQEGMRETCRKVVFATNIAETSITIPGIRFVIDSGVAKVRTLVSHNGMYIDMLRVQTISQAQADQRKGRAGRTGPGYLYRLYTTEQYTKLDKYPKPEILRVDAASTLLHVIAMLHSTKREGNHLSFPLLDKIPRHAQERALETLCALGAIDAKEGMSLTRTGELMARIPTGPMLARTLLESVRVGCMDAVLSVAAVLSCDGGIFISPTHKMEEARNAHRRFVNAAGDHLTLVNALNGFVERENEARRKEFCMDHFLNYRTLESAMCIRKQLDGIMSHGDMMSWGLKHALEKDVAVQCEEAGMEELVGRCLVAGYFKQIARKRSEDGKYVPLGKTGTEGGMGIDIHPSSSLRQLRTRKNPRLVVYDELVLTTKMYLRTVACVEEEWVVAHCNKYFRRAGV